MTSISFNLDKIALLKKARGGTTPDIRYVAILAMIAGCNGFTFHLREDRRHASEEDIKIISDLKEVAEGHVRFTLEGNVREDVLVAIENYNIHQFTIVPVEDGEKTTQRGMHVGEKEDSIRYAMARLKPKKDVKFCIFIEPDKESVEYASSLGFDAIEINSTRYASAFCTNKESLEIAKVQAAASLARKLGMRVHMGHDLNLANVSAIINKVNPDEISVGHAMVVDSFLHGFPRTLKRYSTIASRRQIKGEQNKKIPQTTE